MNSSISKLEETISNLQNKVDQQKLIAQNKLDDFLTCKSTKRIYWTTQNILVEHEFRVPDLTPSASSESSPDIMHVPSPTPSVYETPDKLLDQNFPAMALGSSGNPIVVSDNKD